MTVLHDAQRQAETAVKRVEAENRQLSRPAWKSPEVPQMNEVQASNAHVSAVSEGSGSMNIVPVRIFPAGQQHRAVTTYAFLDNGSSASFIDSALLAKLHAPSAQRTLTLTTVSGKKVLHT